MEQLKCLQFPSGIPQLPSSIALRSYQQQAVENWFANRGRGTLKMATGSGKTIAALAITTELYQKIGLQVVLVVCPYRHLVTQWARECQVFNLEPILAFENAQNWQSQLANQLYTVRNGTRPFLTLITTNSTLIGDRFQSQLKYFPEKTLLIGDEAHNLGAPRLEESLPRCIGLRLALSATPERYFDEAGTETIFNYFGPVLQPELSLADAIELGALVRYSYHPITVTLTETEAQIYAKITQRLGWALTECDGNFNNENVTALLMQRSRLVGAATHKLTALQHLMLTRKNTTHTLFYCGDGIVEETEESQLDAVVRILGREIGYRVNIYTAETSVSQRETLRQQLESGQLQGLVAIRCLDEGVDIPAIQTAVILASSRNPRQFIQRRGRILRNHPGKSRATLFDFIVIPPDLDRETWEVERNLLKKELQRFIEFANLAENAETACEKLLKIQDKYGLE
ncbi:MAG: DNA phosphorothioation system restriction enzyme [Geitlerinemataceae cyanobacterium]